MASGQLQPILAAAASGNPAVASLRETARKAGVDLIEADNVYAAVALLARRQEPLQLVALSADLLDAHEMHVFQLVRTRWPQWPCYVLPSAQFPGTAP